MDKEAIIRLVGAIAGGLTTFYILSFGIRLAARKDTKRRLYFGGFILGLTLACTAFTMLMFWVLFFVDHGGQHVPIFLLIAMFGFFSVYFWGEIVWTKGFWNDEGLGFQSLWNGRRYYEWDDLTGVQFNQSMYWYVLTFRGGKPVRISTYIHGFADLINKIEDMGFSVD